MRATGKKTARGQPSCGVSAKALSSVPRSVKRGQCVQKLLDSAAGDGHRIGMGAGETGGQKVHFFGCALWIVASLGISQQVGLPRYAATIPNALCVMLCNWLPGKVP